MKRLIRRLLFPLRWWAGAKNIQAIANDLSYIILVDYHFSKDQIEKRYMAGEDFGYVVKDILLDKDKRRRWRVARNMRRADLPEEQKFAMGERLRRMRDNAEFNRMVRAQEAYDKAHSNT